MKFYVQPVIRYFLRYLVLGIFVGFPLHFTCFVTFDEALVSANDRPFALVLGFLLLVIGFCIMNCVFIERCFPVLILSSSEICWKCPFRKTKVIPTANCVEIGAYLENANSGIPSEQIYFSDYLHPISQLKKENLPSSKHLIKFYYSEELYRYLINHYPGKMTSCLVAYSQQKKK